jgi:Ca2+-binding EF-hand superfamily protein
MIRSLAATAFIAVTLSTKALAAPDLFATADKNGDGSLDQAEFAGLIDAAAAAGKPKAQKVKAYNMYAKAFARVDKNEDGKISKVEAASMK